MTMATKARIHEKIREEKGRSGVARAIRILFLLGLLPLTVLGLSRTVFVGTIPLSADLPPLVVVKGQGLHLRQLPNAAAASLVQLRSGQPLYLRCRGGEPLYFGPWVGVIDGGSSQIGWVHGRYVSDFATSCDVNSTKLAWLRLRPARLRQDVTVNVRFGPSVETLIVAKANSSTPLWTDGRHIQVEGQRWYPVQLQSGISGWIRGDLLQPKPLALKASLLSWGARDHPSRELVPEADWRMDPDGAAFSVGASYRPRGAAADLQRIAAEQLESGVAAVVLSRSPYPTAVARNDNGTISVQVELYSLAWRHPLTLLDARPEEMAKSLLLGNTQLARDVEELYGPEAALLMRAALIATGGAQMEQFANIIYLLAKDPEVQSMVLALAGEGIRLGEVMTAAASREGMRRYAELSPAGGMLVADLGIRADRHGDWLQRSTSEKWQGALRAGSETAGHTRARMASRLQDVSTQVRAWSSPNVAPSDRRTEGHGNQVTRTVSDFFRSSQSALSQRSDRVEQEMQGWRRATEGGVRRRADVVQTRSSTFHQEVQRARTDAAEQARQAVDAAQARAEQRMRDLQLRAEEGLRSIKPRGLSGSGGRRW